MNKMHFLRSKACLAMASALALALPLFAEDPDDQSDENAPSATSDLPQAMILATDSTALVGSSTAAFTVTRTGPTNAALAVQFAISGTASNSVDYTNIADSITIPAGFLASDIVIQPIFDSARRGNKTVVLTLQTNAAYKLTSHKKATVTLVDDLFNDVAPAVTITSPTNNSVFVLPANVVITAEATDTDGSIKQVSFFSNDHFLGSVSNSPFTLTWTNPPPGRYALFARAVDNVGKSTLSEAVHITVTNAAPVVTWVTPTNGQAFALPANVPLEVTATDADDSVTQVQFISDHHILGTVTSSPFSMTWSNVPPGKHTVTAVARDTFGTKGMAAVSFTVSNAPPVVAITSPAEGASFPAHQDIMVQADASDPDGTVKTVSFWANSRFLGQAKTSPFVVTWKHPPQGDYKLKAIATDNFGQKTTSAPVTIHVTR